MAAFDTGDERDESSAFDPHLLDQMRGVSRVAGVVAMAVAVLVLAGWCFDVEVLKSVVPGLTAMNPGGSAVAFLMAGGALFVLAGRKTPSGGQMRLARSLATVVVGLAAMRLALYILGLEWGPDQWLFRSSLDEYPIPNRMAPNTALGLLLLGIGLLAIDVETRRGYRPAQWLALTTALLALFTLVGYACHAAILISIRTFIPMALNSAAVLGVLALGLLFARPDRGVMSVVAHREMGGGMARRLLPASIVAPALLAWVASAFQRTGEFGPAFGISVFVVATIVLFTALIWWNALLLNRLEAARSNTHVELLRKGQILRSILHSMGDGVVVADQDGRFLIFNPVAERILGLGAIDAPPTEWTSQYGIFSPETGEPLKLEEIPLVRAIHGEATDQVDLLIKSPRLPEGVNISVTGRPLEGADGVEGGVVVFQDTTQRRKAAEAIRQARDEADAANRAKSEFLANMSHEIRTPMNAVIGMTELVLDSELSEVQRAYLKIVKDSAESLLSLINDILDFSKIEAGRLELDHTRFQLRDLLGDAMKTLAVRAHGKDLELACHVAPEVPEFLMGDPYRLRQVITNLVGNALKFTAHGEVVVDVSAEDVTDTEAEIHVAVRDTGIGIPADKLHLLFSAFSQVDASTTRRYGGTGLGLAITRRLVALMSGRIWVESEVGRGSTFHFTARFEPDSSPPVPPATPEALKNLRVLIVDDNSTNRIILEEMLSGWGMRPLSLNSAEAALAELRQAVEQGDPYHIVLSDVQMPDVDGFELAAQIKRDQKVHSTVIMMLSSGSGSTDVSRSRELGAVAHLMKPIKPSELLATVAAVMGSLIQETPLAAGTEPIRPLKILLAEDSLANQQLALGVLTKWGHTLTIAVNGVQALAEFDRGVYDVILMDVQMPEMDGLQATAHIRERERLCGGHVPIVAMTAHAMKGDREECLQAGMDDYVTKPIRWPDLRRALERVIRPEIEPGVEPFNEEGAMATAVQDAAAPAAGAEAAFQSASAGSPVLPLEMASSSSARILDWDEALQAVNGDAALLRDVVESLLTEWPRLLSDLERAAAAEDSKSLRRAAHTLKGSLRFFGHSLALRLAEQAELLAQAGQLAEATGLLPEISDLVTAALSEVQQWLASPGVQPPQ